MTASFPGYTLQLDPSTVAQGRTMLDINNPATGIMVGGTSSGQGVDWGTAQITEYAAQQGMYGDSIASFVYPNRTVTIPLALGNPSAGVDANTALAPLSMKVALIQREGGWLLRQRQGGPAMYADVVDAQLSVPDVWGESAGFETGVTLTLICLPDFYGDEVTLDVQSATGVFDGVLTASGAQAVISGDYMSRASVSVTDTSGNDQHGMIWGARSRNYSSAPSAALFFEAESLAMVSYSGPVPVTGASGGQAVQTDDAIESNTWTPVLGVGSLASEMTHAGSYEVWARVQAPPGVAGEMRFAWGVGSAASPVTNPASSLPSAANEWALIDLGTITLAPPAGSDTGSGPSVSWFGLIELNLSQVSYMYIDTVMLQPLDEAAGTLTYDDSLPLNQVTSGLFTSQNYTDTAVISGSAWSITPGPPEWTASVTVTGSASDILQCTDFGLNLPSAAVVRSVTVTVNRSRTTSAVVTASLTTGGAAMSPSTATSAYVTYQFTSLSLSAATVNATAFGVDLQAEGSASPSVTITHVQIQASYTLAAAPDMPPDAVIYADNTAQVRFDGASRAYGATPGPIANINGSLCRLPPSGLEAQPVQLFVKPSRGNLTTESDSGIDGLTVQVSYRPCWMFRP